MVESTKSRRFLRAGESLRFGRLRKAGTGPFRGNFLFHTRYISRKVQPADADRPSWILPRSPGHNSSIMSRSLRLRIEIGADILENRLYRAPTIARVEGGFHFRCRPLMQITCPPHPGKLSTRTESLFVASLVLSFLPSFLSFFLSFILFHPSFSSLLASTLLRTSTSEFF